MKTGLKFLLFFLLPIIAVLLFPPSTLSGGLPVLVVAIVSFGLLAFAVWRGRSWALVLAIFLQGFNAIIRLMMFLSHAVPANSGGQPDIPYIITSLLSIALSVYLVLRLDRVDVRSTITH